MRLCVSVIEDEFRRLYNSQLKTLRSGQTNEWLASVDRRFLKAVHDQHVDISGRELVEDDPPCLFMILLRLAQIVPPASAAKYFADHLRIEHSNHNSIAKPMNDQAQQHRALRRFLRVFAETASHPHAAGPSNG
jgi:hypothetical protein